MNIIGSVGSTDKEVLLEWMKDKMYWEDIITSHISARTQPSRSRARTRNHSRRRKWQTIVSDVSEAAIKHFAEDGVVEVNVEKYLVTLLFDNKNQELIFNLNYASRFSDVIKTGVRSDGTQN